MEWKRLEIQARLISAKQKVLALFRLISSVGNDNPNVSPPNSARPDEPYVPINLLRNYAFEAELKKAEALEYWNRRRLVY